MYCRFCGATVDADDKYCSVCGARLKESTRISKPASPASESDGSEAKQPSPVRHSAFILKSDGESKSRASSDTKTSAFSSSDSASQERRPVSGILFDPDLKNDETKANSENSESADSSSETEGGSSADAAQPQVNAMHQRQVYAELASYESLLLMGLNQTSCVAHVHYDEDDNPVVKIEPSKYYKTIITEEFLGRYYDSLRLVMNRTTVLFLCFLVAGLFFYGMYDCYYRGFEVVSGYFYRYTDYPVPNSGFVRRWVEQYLVCMLPGFASILAITVFNRSVYDFQRVFNRPICNATYKMLRAICYVWIGLPYALLILVAFISLLLPPYSKIWPAWYLLPMTVIGIGFILYSIYAIVFCLNGMLKLSAMRKSIGKVLVNERVNSHMVNWYPMAFNFITMASVIGIVAICFLALGLKLN